MPAIRNVHLRLPTDTYERLKEQAARERRPATAVAREAIEQWLRQGRRRAVREEIAAYAARTAGSQHDLDPWLEKPPSRAFSVTADDQLKPEKRIDSRPPSMPEITLTLPDDAARTLRVPEERVAEELKIAAAMKLLEMGRISSGKAAELAGIPKPLFLTRMVDYGVVTFQYSKEELRRDAGLD